MTPHCPNANALADYAAGRLTDSASQQVDEHLHTCPTCQHTVVDLAVEDDTLLILLRTPAGASISDDPRCQEALQRIQQIGQEPTLASGAAPSTSEPMLGTLREYKLLSKLGEGGMGAVYKAEHTKLRRIVALKVLPSDRMQNAHAVARFEREMQAVGALDHPNIVRAMDAGEHEGRHYLVMEYVRGCDLSQLVREQGPLPIAEACELVRQAAIGLQHAHEHGLVHRDIKPSNLMLAQVGNAEFGVRNEGKHSALRTPHSALVKILDLGLALLSNPTDDGRNELTGSGQLMGTLDYMAPEQGTDSHVVDIRADVYSLGATLYKLLCGEAPFAGPKYNTSVKKMMALCTEAPQPIGERRAEMPSGLAAILHRCLAKKPEERFATPEELARALAPFATGADLNRLQASGASSGPSSLTSATHSTTPQRSAAANTDATIDLAAPASITWTSRPRWLWPAVAAGLAAAIVLGVIITIRTPKGLVEIELGEGVDANQVAIAIKKGGQEVQVADASRGWTLRIEDGKYEVDLKAGADRFVLDPQTISVMRDNDCTVRVRIKDVPAVASVPRPTSPLTEPRESPSLSKPAQPRKANEAANPEKPFALIRDDKVVRDFKTWAGMLADLQAGDTIEVQGRGPYLLPKPPLKHLDVTVRAAAGFRPELRLPGAILHKASLKFEGLDLVFPHDDREPGGLNFFRGMSGPKARLEISLCRLTAYAISTSRNDSVKVSDSLLLLGTSFVVPDDGEADFNNNVIVFSEGGFRIPQGGSNVRLTNNTIIAWGRLLFFGHPDATLPERPVRIESRNNLIANDAGFGGASIFFGQSAEKNAAAIDWQGAENLYCPYPQAGFTEKNNGGQTVQVEPLDAWARKLSRTEREPNSQIAAWPQWKLAEAWWAKDADYFATLRRQIESAIPPQQRHEIGPQWELIGPGAAYLKALAVAGTPVAEKDLLPEALAGGPCAILRDGKEIQGFRTLQDACSTAVDKDVIELRTNNNVGGTTLNGKGRLLTIRAAAGYTPQADLISVTNGERIVVEGIQFTLKGGLDGYQADKTVPSGQYVRIANCSIRNQGTRGGTQGIPMFSVSHGTGAAGAPLEILNCWVDGTVMVGVRADQKIRFHNCILPGVDPFPAQPENKEAWHTIEFDRCAVWSPEPRAYRGGLTWTSTSQPIHIEVVANNTLFETHSWIRRQQDTPLRWKGSRNLFRIGNPDWFHTADQPEPWQVISGLEELRKAFQSDADSVEAHPLAWEPEQWKLLPTSPGYQAGPEGKDIGADVDRLTQAMKGSAATEASAVPQTTAIAETWTPGSADGVLKGFIPRPALLDKARWQIVAYAPNEWVQAAWNSQGTHWAVLTGTGGVSPEVRVFDLINDTLRLQHVFPLNKPGASLSWHPNGREIAVGDDDQLKVLDITTGRFATYVPTEKKRALHVAWSPDGKQIAIGSHGNPQAVISLWDCERKTVVSRVLFAEKPTAVVGAIAWHPSEPLLTVYSMDGQVFFVDAQTHNSQLLEQKFATRLAASVAWNPQGTVCAMGSDDRTRLFDRTGRVLAELPLMGTQLTWFNDGKRLATTSRVLDVSDPSKPSVQFSGDYVSPAPDGRIALQHTGAYNTPGKFYVSRWDERTRSYVPHQTLSAGLNFLTGQAIAVQPQGNMVAVGCSRSMHWWNLSTKSRSGSRPLTVSSNAMAFSPDGKLLFSFAREAHDSELACFRVVENTLERTFTAKPVASLQRAVWSEDSQQLATLFAKEPSITLWNPLTGESSQVRSSTGKEIADFALLPGRQGIVLAVGQAVELVTFGNEPRTVKLADFSEAVFRLAASTDGKHVAVIGMGTMVASLDVLGQKLRWEQTLEGQSLVNLSFQTDRDAFVVMANKAQTIRWLEFHAEPANSAPQLVQSPKRYLQTDCLFSPQNRFLGVTENGACDYLLGVPGGRLIELWGHGFVGWTADEQNLLGTDTRPMLIAYEGSSGLPVWQGINLADNQWASFTSAGEPIAHSSKAYDQLRWVVQHDDGRCECLNWPEFQKSYVSQIRKSAVGASSP